MQFTASSVARCRLGRRGFSADAASPRHKQERWRRCLVRRAAWSAEEIVQRESPPLAAETAPPTPRRPSDGFMKAVRFDCIGASLRTELAVEQDYVAQKRCFTSLGALQPECDIIDSWKYEQDAAENAVEEASCSKYTRDPTFASASTCASASTFASMSTAASSVLPIELRTSTAKALSVRAEQLKDVKDDAAVDESTSSVCARAEPLEDGEEYKEVDSVAQDRSHHRCKFTSLRRLGPFEGGGFRTLSGDLSPMSQGVA